ncbi:Mu transposase domain-containing protein [Roseateles sp.]|uniref:Mu transposase domain-containing protein n=1 Tax=Roseateles sp. TaxID=1971397 RepID=UPI003BA9F706
MLERVGDAIRFNPELIKFACHHRFEARPVAVALGNEKGRVERAIRYVRESFFAAREFTDLGDLNAQARQWCEGLASDRRWPEDGLLSVRQAFEVERASLLALPVQDYPLGERAAVQVGKTPYVRFQLNDYSVPHTYVRRTLAVLADEARVRVFDGAAEIASHRHPRRAVKPRCARGQGQGRVQHGGRRRPTGPGLQPPPRIPGRLPGGDG